MEHNGTQTIETERLVLRRLEKRDLSLAYKNWLTDHNVTKYLRWQTYTNIKDAKTVIYNWIKLYKHKEFYHWVIVPKDINEPIGTISVVEVKEMSKTAHVGYSIGSRWWHKGYVSEALNAIIKYLFLDCEFNRIESMHDVLNVNSGKVMEKCGMTYEGTLRQADYNNRGIIDVKLYALLKEDFLKTDD